MPPLSLPDFPEVTTETLQEVSRRHGLDTDAFSLLPQVGIFNLIYVLGEDFILRVPRDHPISSADARKESVAVPVAREAGVRTPRIISFDDSLDLLPRDPQPGRSWAERPLGMLLDVMRFLLDSPGPEWSKWIP